MIAENLLDCTFELFPFTPTLILIISLVSTLFASIYSFCRVSKETCYETNLNLCQSMSNKNKKFSPARTFSATVVIMESLSYRYESQKIKSESRICTRPNDKVSTLSCPLSPQWWIVNWMFDQSFFFKFHLFSEFFPSNNRQTMFQALYSTPQMNLDFNSKCKQCVVFHLGLFCLFRKSYQRET